MKPFLTAIAMLLASFPTFAQSDTPSVASRGKITAGDTVSRIAAPYVNGAPAILESILVKKGETVAQNQPVAILQGQAKASAALASTTASLALAKSESVIKIQEAKNALDELMGTYGQNNEVLNELNPPRSEREKINYEQKALVRQIGHAEAMLKLVEENAKNAIASAEASVKEAEFALADFTIKSPIAGEIIEIHARVGEMIGADGVCEVANTKTMFVEAEVYVSDINRIAIGNLAEATPEALPDTVLKGRVVEISRYVKTNRIFSQDPSEYSDMKVINVKIELDDSAKVEKLLGTQVRTRIFVEK